MSWRHTLKLNTDKHKEPDTRLTKAEVDAIRETIGDASRTDLKKLVDKIRDSLLNPYYNKELDSIEGGIDGDEQDTLPHIRSNIRGLLGKMTLTSQSGGKSDHTFHFKSVQIHGTVVNGRRKTRKNTVRVNGSKGEKKIEIFDSSKKRKTYTNSKKLSAKEIANIRRGIFMPGLFRGL